MPRAIFEVQVVDRNSGDERWVTVEAQDRKDAIEQIVRLGEIVGAARLISLANQPNSSVAGNFTPRQPPLPDSGGATTCAWLGFIFCVPVALMGLIWGLVLVGKTGGRRGLHATIVGAIALVLWLFLMILLFAGYASEGY